MIDIRVRQWAFLRNSGFALPPVGIFVGKRNQFLIMHEFGHVLQARKYGLLKFYFLYAIPSVYSFLFFRRKHRTFYTELDANRLALAYFETKVSSELLSEFRRWAE